MTTETVLIIDDSAEIRALLESLLPYAGYETLSAGTGWEGLGLAVHARPDVMLLDLELPDIGGLKVLEQLNRARLSIPAVIMTGYGSEGVAATALRLGALGYLIKPFTAEEVLSTVEKALTVGRLARERASLSALAGRHARHLQALSVLGQAVVNGMDCDLLLQRIVEAALYVTRAERSWLSLRQEESGRFRVVAQRGKPDCTTQEFSEAAGAESLAPVLAQGTLLRTRAAPGTAIRLQTEDEVKALIQVPLGLPEGPVGLLSVDRQATDIPFSEQDEQLLLILASYALLALERNRQAGREAGTTQQ
ncbi:MAG TPA: response regulator [Anaerolineae bacterium]|nr:response regulator [Anaerolineae bacterium]